MSTCYNNIKTAIISILQVQVLSCIFYRVTLVSIKDGGVPAAFNSLIPQADTGQVTGTARKQ